MLGSMIGRRWWGVLAVAAAWPAAMGTAPAREIAIVNVGAVGDVERTAAEELSRFLSQRHAQDRFRLLRELPATGDAILLASRLDESEVAPDLPPASRHADEFVVTHGRRGDREIGVIAGATPRALMDGVHAVLERAHGQGFYLSGNFHAAAPGGAFTFAGWDLRDWPLVAERTLLLWPNFLSGCSTWNHAEWLSTVRQLSRLRGTHLMLHTYANDPLLAFSFRGETKPVGWINSTRRGRTYAVEHISDVRAIPGAEGLFADAWFGTEAAKVPDERRVEAARTLMRAVFAEARRHGLATVWAIDVDTFEAHPQELIAATLSSEDVLEAPGKRSWTLVRPDTAGGRAFHRAWLEAILRATPAIDRLVVWVRAPGMSPAMDLRVKDLPVAWQRDLRARTGHLPEAGDPKVPAAGIYFASKVVETWREALRELGRTDVEVGFGSWTWVFPKFQIADALLPEGMPFYLKDYSDAIGADARTRREVARFSGRRPVIPIAYAHHDDGQQCGPPLRLPEAFRANLEEAGFRGHGVVIWLTRPLDVYFRAGWDRLWESGRDLTERDCLARAARDWTGPAAADAMTEFLVRWWRRAPTFGRETTAEFAPLARARDPGLEDRDEAAGADAAARAAEVRRAAAGRREWLDRAGALAVAESAQDWVRYFRGYEEWTQRFLEAQAVRAAGRADDLAHRPEVAAVRAFSEAAQALGATAGERGQVASLAGRWMTFFTAERQRLRVEPLRVRFHPTNHDPIARAPGRMTFAFGADGGAWLVLGAEETGCVVEGVAAQAVSSGWVRTARLALKVADVRGNSPIAPGRYRVSLHLPPGAAQRLRVFGNGEPIGEVDVPASGGTTTLAEAATAEAGAGLELTVESAGGDPVRLSGVEFAPAP